MKARTGFKIIDGVRYDWYFGPVKEPSGDIEMDAIPELSVECLASTPNPASMFDVVPPQIARMHEKFYKQFEKLYTESGA